MRTAPPLKTQYPRRTGTIIILGEETKIREEKGGHEKWFKMLKTLSNISTKYAQGLDQQSPSVSEL
jgi:hypothetical protein